MAKIKNPLQFSRYFSIDQSRLASLGVFDPTMNVDAKLFIDPLLLSDSAGYEKQLEVYKTAEKTTKGIYVVIDIGKMGKKNERIWKLRNEMLGKGLPASEIFVIDGKIKPSASKL